MAVRSMRPKSQLETVLGVARIGAMLIGAVSVGVAVVKLGVPLYQYVVFTALPAAWAAFRSFLAPQYLFLLVNLIILVIWKLSEKRAPDTAATAGPAAAVAPPLPLKPKVVPADVFQPSPREMRHVNEVGTIPPPSPRTKAPPPAYGHVDAAPSPRKPAAPYAHAALAPRQRTASPPQELPRKHDAAPPAPRSYPRPPSPDTNSDDSCVTAEDDPVEYGSPEPVSPLRHTYRRLAAIATPSRSAPVTPHPDAPESLEDAWRAITGAGAGTARLRKNETWRVPTRVVEMQQPPPARREMRKSETFNDAATRRRPLAAGTAGSEAAPAPVTWERDELNQKFDAFIKKVNDQFRLQRQESVRRQRQNVARRGY